MIGRAARIDIPGHGMFIVSAYDPKNPSFEPVGRVQGQSLKWTVNGDRVEISSKANVLARAEAGTVWVYHDPRYRSADLPNNVRLQAAETVEWLVPKK